MKRIEYKENDVINGFIYLKEINPHVSPSRVFRKALFMCKCGKSFEAIIRSIVSGKTKSCGCFIDLIARKDRNASHHLRYHPLYKIWCSVKTRCNNKKRADYCYYGGRGICLSEEFHNFEVFFEYLISLPDYKNREANKLTLDRIDNSKNYERGNLRWVSRKIQANNRRKCE